VWHQRVLGDHAEASRLEVLDRLLSSSVVFMTGRSVVATGNSPIGRPPEQHPPQVRGGCCPAGVGLDGDPVTRAEDSELPAHGSDDARRPPVPLPDMM